TALDLATLGNVPRPAAVWGQVAITDHGLGPFLQPDALAAIAVDPTGLERAMAARADLHAGLGVAGELALLEAAVAVPGDEGPAGLATMDFTPAKARPRPVRDRHAGMGVAEDRAILDRRRSPVVDEEAGILAAVDLAAAQDRLGPVAMDCHA